jgi:hypothetical protein
MNKFILFFIFIFSLSARAQVGQGRIYDLGHTDGPVKFTQQSTLETLPNGDKKWSSTIKDASNATVMTEEAQIKEGRVVYQLIQQLQIKEAYQLKVESGRGTFSTYKTSGKIGDIDFTKPSETKTVKIEDSFITGPVAEAYLQKNFPTLLDGKIVYAHFGIFELLKVVDFYFKKKSATDKELVVKMEPDNFFISLLVDPIYLTFDKATKTIVRFKGRTPLRQKVEGEWKPYDAEIIYSKGSS